MATNGLTPAEYRERYGLKADYPMVAPTYSEARRETAKRLGLGRKPGQKLGGSTSEDAPAPEELASEPQAEALQEEAAKPARKPRKRKDASEAKAAAQAQLSDDSEG